MKAVNYITLTFALLYWELLTSMQLLRILTATYVNYVNRLVSKFGRVCERRKLRVNVGKSKVMRCSKYSNGIECM